MTTESMAQRGEAGSDRDTPWADVDREPTESNTRRRLVMVGALVVLALGMGAAFAALIRARSGGSPGTTGLPGTTRSAQVPRSAIRFAAAPHSVVHVVSAPNLGPCHVQTPTKMSG